MARISEARRTDIAKLRGLTMACWWPSRVMGWTEPDWPNIALEMGDYLHGETFYREERGNSGGHLRELDRLYGLACQFSRKALATS